MLIHHDIRLRVTRAHHDDLIRAAQGNHHRRRFTPGAPNRRFFHR
jgi:hypothetical protein